MEETNESTVIGAEDEEKGAGKGAGKGIWQPSEKRMKRGTGREKNKATDTMDGESKRGRNGLLMRWTDDSLYITTSLAAAVTYVRVK